MFYYWTCEIENGEREHKRIILEKTEQKFCFLIDSIAPLKKKYEEKTPIMCALFRLLILVKCLQITTSSLSYSPLHRFLWFFHHRYAAHAQKSAKVSFVQRNTHKQHNLGLYYVVHRTWWRESLSLSLFVRFYSLKIHFWTLTAGHSRSTQMWITL